MANRKLRHTTNQELRVLGDFEEFDRILIAGGYTD